MGSQFTHLVFTVFAGVHGWQHLNNYQPVFQAVKVNFIRSIGNTHRNNWHTCSNCGVKRASFKRQQAATTAARPFREHPDRDFTFLKVIDHFGNGAVRFGAVITIDQQVTREPVQQAEERHPQKALFTHRDRWRQHDVRGGDHIVVILMITDIDGVAEIFCAFRQAGFDLQAIQRRQSTKHAAKGGDMLRVARAEQAVNAAEHADQNAIDNGENCTNNE
ncbi:hypothetical protein D3C72_754480 [compost metagenome]